jgi:hypothetical protein
VTDDYRELVQNALDAMEALLDASYADALPDVRHVYGTLRRTAGLSEPAEPPAEPAWRAEVRAAEAIRDSLTNEQRRELVREALADGGMTASELTERINAKVCTPDCGIYRAFNNSIIRIVAMRMVADGEIARTAETYRGGMTRYRFSLPLRGAIADLARALRDEPCQ